MLIRPGRVGQVGLTKRQGGGGGGSAPPEYGTSSTRYSVMGTGLRWTNLSAQHATNTYFAIEFRFGTPDYQITDPRVFCPSFWSPSTGGEVYIAGGASITIQGWSIETSAGVWTACDGAAEAGVAVVTNADGGKWLPRVQCTLAANTVYRGRMTFRTSGTSIAIPRVGDIANQANAPGGQEKINGGTTTWYAKLTDNLVVNNSGGNGIAYKPVMMVAKGGDGRPAILVLGDSIGYGANDNGAQGTWTSRNEFGYVGRGLDDIVGAKRLGYHLMCVPGQAPCGSVKGWDSATRWAGKIYAIDQIVAQEGQVPFDEVLDQHVTNAIPYSDDGGNLRTGMNRHYDLVLGKWNKPITQIECLSAVTSSDGYATVVNQTEQPGYAYPAGQAWTFNADVGGADGLGDAAAYYRANGKIIGSIAPWRYAAADLTTNRDRYPVRPFSTTLASAYASGTSISTVAAPTPGMQIYMEQDSGTYGTPRDVPTVTGAGPYTSTLNGSPGTAAAIGKRVTDAWGDSIHPSGLLHKDVLAQSIVDWKIARGWS